MTALSGGERRRLALALVVASGANFLVLDEPTNHLDLESREALEAALEAFPGTVLLVTHDRALLDAVSGRVLAIEDGRLVSYAGGWAEYLRRRDAEAAARRRPQPKREKPKRRSATARRRRRRSSSSSARSPAARSGSPSSSGSSPRTGRTSTSSPPTAPPATTSTALLARWESLFEAAAQERSTEPRPSRSGQKASKAGGSVGTATISCQRPSRSVISSTWSMSSSRPRRCPRAR